MKKYNIAEKIIFFILLLANEEFFYFLNINRTNFVKQYFVLLDILIFVIYMVTIISSKDKNLFNFKHEIFFLLILSILEPLNTYGMYGQPVGIGYKITMFYFIYIIYFYFSYIISKKNFINSAENIIIILSIAGALLYIYQYSMYPNVVLAGMDYRIQSRYDQPRLYIPIAIFFFSYFICFTKIFYKRGVSLISSIGMLLDLFVIVYVNKTRACIFSIIITSVILFIILIMKRNSHKKLFVSITVIVLTFIIMQNVPSIQNGLLGKMVKITNENDSSVITRFQEKNFYINQFKENIFLGRGDVDRESLPAVDGIVYNYYLDDIGLMGIIIKFGLLGSFTFLIIFIKMLCILLKYDKNDYLHFQCVGMMLSFLFMCITIPFLDVREHIIYVVLFLSFIDYIKHKNLANKDVKLTSPQFEGY